MTILVLSVISIAFSGLTYISAISWISIVGFVFAIAAWVMGRKMLQTGTQVRYARPAMVLGVIGTFANLAGILVSFIVGSLFFGGPVVF